jgi:protein-S-isoprenylcysteine O-methyltransferase Ste14
MTTQTKPYSLTQFIVMCTLTLVTFPALMLFLGGNWLWVEGLLFGLWMSAMILGSTAYLFFKDPALLAERSKRPGSDNQKSWDKYLLSGIYLVALTWLVILPLDAERFHWSPAFPLWLKVIGGLMLLPALYLIQRTTMDNTFLSTMVRIQGERKQHVITTGTYGFVRHPLYLGCTFMMFGAPLFVGSVVGLVITALAFSAIIVRILGEEKMLETELEGYAEYKQQVRYRLIPFIW